jgi:hypothetical protein
MPQAASAGRPQSSDRRHALFGLTVGLAVIGALCALVFVLRPEIANPSTATCIALISGAPLLAIGRFLDQRNRRRQAGELRDARRGGISIGVAQRPRPGIQTMIKER